MRALVLQWNTAMRSKASGSKFIRAARVSPVRLVGLQMWAAMVARQLFSNNQILGTEQGDETFKVMMNFLTE